MQIKTVTFPSVGLELTGHLYLPENFDENQRYKAIVMTPPAHQIKEQTCAVYGPLFAAHGFIALAFDYNSKGESQGYNDSFRNDEHALRKQEDLRNAISFLCSQPWVDTDQLFGVGICGGGNVMSSVLITDLRVKAFASISAMLATDSWFFTDPQAFRAMIEAANAARQAMYNSGKAESMDLFGYDDPDYISKHPELSGAQLDGYEYYGTPRAGSATYPRFSNQVISSIYETAVLNIGEHYADRMLQPFLGVVGAEAETAPATELFYEKVTAPKELFRVPGASHVDLYDVEAYVTIAVDKITDFFSRATKA